LPHSWPASSTALTVLAVIIDAWVNSV